MAPKFALAPRLAQDLETNILQALRCADAFFELVGGLLVPDASVSNDDFVAACSEVQIDAEQFKTVDGTIGVHQVSCVVYYSVIVVRSPVVRLVVDILQGCTAQCNTIQESRSLYLVLRNSPK